MAKMSEDDLIAFLEAEQADAFQYTEGEPASARQKAMRDYLRYPYGTEQDGRSQVVASDVFDAVEGMLPELVEVFVSSDKAVVFDPVSAEDEAGAKQATEACNYVFYKQNNGFLILYTAAKDALLMRTGGVKWWWDVRRTPKFETFSGDEMQIASHLMMNPKAEVISKEELEPEELPPEIAAQFQAMGIAPPPMPPRFTIRVKTVEQKGKVCVQPIPADELEVASRHNSILLDDCPFVCHKGLKTLSDIHQMGFTKVTEDDVKAARLDRITQDREFYDTVRGGNSTFQEHETGAVTRGWIREEYVLIDFDGDGIAERRKITRLGRMILENTEVSHVPIAAWTPYLLTHKFDGLSVWDLVQDLQRLNTDILRNQADNLALANNQETVVLTDTNGNPKANIDDILNRRVGGVMREYSPGAIRPYVERWQGIEAMPFIERLRQDKEQRIGYAPYLQMEDAQTLSKTATEVSKGSNARQKRMKLMARMMAEAMVKPMFRGIFKTLTDYCMEKISFRLHGNYVQMDPQEWRDGYDMTINVGIGTGDAQQQMQFLMGLTQAQAGLMQSPFGPMLIDAQKVYNLNARLIELAGFKSPADFLNEPPKDEQGKPVQPQPQPNPDVIKEQMRGQITLQVKDKENQLTMQSRQAELQVQAANDARDAQREERRFLMEQQLERERIAADERKHEREMQFEMWKEQLHAAVGLKEAAIGAQATTDAALASADAEINREIN